MVDDGDLQRVVLWLFLHEISKDKGVSSPNVSKIVTGMPMDAVSSVRFVSCNLNNYIFTKTWCLNCQRIRTDTDFTVLKHVNCLIPSSIHFKMMKLNLLNFPGKHG